VTTRPLERLFAAVALFVASSAVFPLFEGAGDSTLVQAPQDARLTALSLLTYGVAAVLLVRRRTPLLELLAANKLLFSLAALPAFSILWSSDPGTTARDALALALTMMLGIYLATAFRPAELAAVVAWLLATLVLASALLAVLSPRYGVDHLRGGAWRGVFTTKNELGRIAALSGAVWLVRAATRRGTTPASLAIAAFSVLVLERSGARTGYVVLALIALFVVLLPALRAHSSIAVPTGAALAATGVLAGLWLVHHTDTVLEQIGGSTILTGRSEIWTVVWTMISAHPWFGYGFAVFWQPDGPVQHLWALVGATPPHAHNGVLELWLDLGALGVAFFAGSFFVAGLRATRALRRAWSFESILPAAYLIFFALYNVTETTLLHQHSLFWVLYTAVVVQLGLPARRPEPAAARVTVNVAAGAAEALG
jgi:O-antigen ligase